MKRSGNYPNPPAKKKKMTVMLSTEANKVKQIFGSLIGRKNAIDVKYCSQMIGQFAGSDNCFKVGDTKKFVRLYDRNFRIKVLNHPNGLVHLHPTVKYMNFYTVTSITPKTTTMILRKRIFAVWYTTEISEYPTMFSISCTGNFYFTERQKYYNLSEARRIAEFEEIYDLENCIEIKRFCDLKYVWETGNLIVVD